MGFPQPGDSRETLSVGRAVSLGLPWHQRLRPCLFSDWETYQEALACALPPPSLAKGWAERVAPTLNVPSLLPFPAVLLLHPKWQGREFGLGDWFCSFSLLFSPSRFTNLAMLGMAGGPESVNERYIWEVSHISQDIPLCLQENRDLQWLHGGWWMVGGMWDSGSARADQDREASPEEIGSEVCTKD